MKFKHLIFSITIVFVGLFSCKNDTTPNENKSKEVKTEEEVVPKVKNEVQVGDEKLIYKVSLGVLPDLSYKGLGMKVAKVHKNRPGFIGGMQDGDIVKEINGNSIKDLIEYTKILGKYKKGDSAELTVDRDGKTIKIKIVFD